ncbi:MAG: hypothetical protein LBV00_01720 [Propionibacteriaceae bacterium]|jgi:hypothetical protein|nr:hypothetical protein [Propionibacteriaceae bacterium]
MHEDQRDINPGGTNMPTHQDKEPWFGRGGGIGGSNKWGPRTWQGWLITIAIIVVVVAAVTLLTKFFGGA